MQELGGIPGIGLSLGAETFIAPVTKLALQLLLFSKKSYLMMQEITK
jgi:hypothetical protein